MSDDLHTPDILAALSDPLKTANDLLHTKKVFGFRTITVNKLNQWGLSDNTPLDEWVSISKFDWLDAT